MLKKLTLIFIMLLFPIIPQAGASTDNTRKIESLQFRLVMMDVINPGDHTDAYMEVINSEAYNTSTLYAHVEVGEKSKGLSFRGNTRRMEGVLDTKDMSLVENSAQNLSVLLYDKVSQESSDEFQIGDCTIEAAKLYNAMPENEVMCSFFSFPVFYAVFIDAVVAEE